MTIHSLLYSVFSICSLNLDKTGEVCQDIKTWSENLQTGKVYVKKCLIAIMPQTQGEVKKTWKDIKAVVLSRGCNSYSLLLFPLQ